MIEQSKHTLEALSAMPSAELNALAASKIHGWRVGFGSWEALNGEFLHCHLYESNDGAVMPVMDYSPATDRNQSGELLCKTVERGANFAVYVDRHPMIKVFGGVCQMSALNELIVSDGLKERMERARQTRPLVYLACPYSHPDRAVRLERFWASNRMAAQLMRDGLNVFAPISMSHPVAECAQLPGHWEFWEAFDTAFLSCCHKLFVLMLDGWQESVGVQAEIGIAKRMGIEIEYLEDA